MKTPRTFKGLIRGVVNEQYCAGFSCYAEGRGAHAGGMLWKTPIHAMVRYANSFEDRLRRKIRDTIAIDPIASIARITERLTKRLSHSFDRRYILQSVVSANFER